MREALVWEIAGMVFIVVLGVLMHFTFELSVGNPVVGAFAAVNESTWEHFKLSVFPALLFALVESRFLKVNNFLPAKALGILLMPISIVTLFYGYQVFIPDNLLMDILIFIAAVIIGQAASFLILVSRRDLSSYDEASVATLLVLSIVFVVFTFYPPAFFLFQDPISGGYGIIGH